MWNYLGDDNQSIALQCPKCGVSNIFIFKDLSEDKNKFKASQQCWNCNYSHTDIDRDYLLHKHNKQMIKVQTLSISIILAGVLIILVQPFGFPYNWLQSLAVIGFAVLLSVYLYINFKDNLVYDVFYQQDGFGIAYEKYTQRMVEDGITRLKINKKSQLVRVGKPEYQECFIWSENNLLYLVPTNAELPSSKLSSDIEGMIRIPINSIDFFMEESKNEDTQQINTVMHLNDFKDHYYFGLEDFYILDNIIPEKNYSQTNEEYIIKRYVPKGIPRNLAFEAMKDMYKMHRDGIFTYEEYLEKRKQILKRIISK